MIKTSLNPEAQQILQIFRSHNIQSLWHFTDIRNLPLIKKLNGLRSKEFLEKRGYLTRVYCGGNELSHNLDRDLGNWDKISLNFTPHTPMAHHIKKEKHLIFIEIDIKVATFERVHFTDCNATRLRNGQKREKGIKGLNNVKFEYIRSKPKPNDQNWRKFVQAEVLVPHHIPLSYFKKIHFISEASLSLGKILWSGNTQIFAVTPRVFADYDYTQDKWTILNPFIQNVRVDISQESQDLIRIKIEVSGLTGSKIIVRIKKSSGSIIEDRMIELPNPRKDTIEEIFKFSNPDLEIEVLLDEILWYKRRIKNGSVISF